MKIIALNEKPFHVTLEDQVGSVFVNTGDDGKTTSVLMDQGDGLGRVNGARLEPKKGLEFYVRENHLRLKYSRHDFDLGDLGDLDASGWVARVNATIERQC